MSIELTWREVKAATVIFYLVVALAVMVLFSCSSTNKHKTVTETKTDSVSHVKVDSGTLKKKSNIQVKRQSKVVKKQADKTTEKETVYLFDTSHANGTEYFNDNGNHIPVTGKLVSVTKREKVHDKGKVITKSASNDSTAAISNDSSHLNKTADVDLHKTEKVKDKTVKRTTFSWWWLLLLIPLYLIYRYRKQIPYLNLLFK